MIFIGSRDWLHAPSGPKQYALLCYNCHTYYKQYGELPPSNRSDNLFQPVQTDSPEGSPGRMRTRNKAKETVSIYFFSFKKRLCVSLLLIRSCFIAY